ncbi:T9SS type A sorting domain-containing protein [Porphyromonas endodontalis]
MSKQTTPSFRRTLIGCLLAVFTLAASTQVLAAANAPEPIAQEQKLVVDFDAPDDDFTLVRAFSTSSDLVIELPTPNVQLVTIYDITGRVWYKASPQGEGVLRIGHDQLPSGLLLVEVISKEGHRKTFKVKL